MKAIYPRGVRVRGVRPSLLTLGILVLAASCGAAATYLTAATWDIFNVAGHPVAHALETFKRVPTSKQEHEGARFVMQRTAMNIIQALQDDRDDPQSDLLLRHIHEASK